MTKSEYYNMLNENIKEFQNTRDLSNTKFLADTNRLKESVMIYDDANREVQLELPANFKSNMKVKVIDSGTVNAAYYYKKVGYNVVAMLNFADAKKPGGWPEDGAPTQEENMCRTTNMYEALIIDECMQKYYLKNNINQTVDHIDEAYSDTIIYLRDVAILKDDRTYERVNTKYVDVIVCPAPCGNIKNVESILIPRMRAIVKTAYENGVTDLILGAWGCGAFGQSPKVVAECFTKVLKELPVFDSVIFAFKSTIDGLHEKDSTKNIFRRALEKEFIVEEDSVQ